MAALDERIGVVAGTTPVIGRTWRKFRIDGSEGEAEDLTGNTVKFIVKQDLTHDDSRELVNLTATLDADPTTGKFTLPLTVTDTTHVERNYFGELRRWGVGVPVDGPPSDAVPLDYVVFQQVDQVP